MIERLKWTENSLHVRMNDVHLQKPVASHFSLLGHSVKNLIEFIIEKIHRDDPNFWSLNKSFWIQMLGALVPSGHNTDPLMTRTSQARLKSL